MHELVLSRGERRLWIALLRDGRAIELDAAPAGGEALRPGQLWLARVVRAVGPLGALFADPGAGEELFVPRGVEATGARPGEQVLVEVRRRRLGRKAARASARPVLAGRLLVWAPGRGSGAVSRQVRDRRQRERLAAAVAGLSPGAAGEFIARAAAADAPLERLRAESRLLLDAWDGVRRRAGAMTGPGLVLDACDAIVRAALDAPADTARIAVDDEGDRARVVDRLDPVDPRLAARVELHPGRGRLWRELQLDRDVAAALARRVDLPGGGRLTIESTEALVAIDVDSHRAARGEPGDRPLVEVNLQAAREIARQLRLRNLGGAIAVDFAGTIGEGDRVRIREALARALAGDPVGTEIVTWPAGGVLQLNRRRGAGDLASRLTEPCPRCDGRGRLAPGA